MKKMSNESNLQVTFSRQCSRLFKKASELCTLCDAQIALVIFSPCENARRKANVCEINTQLTQINNTLDIEKKLGDELSHLRKEFKAQCWWTCSIDRMNWAQLEMFKKALEKLRNLFEHNVNNL
ncbi:hypothetical protein RYX36_014059, partial [Vicia faba]